MVILRISKLWQGVEFVGGGPCSLDEEYIGSWLIMLYLDIELDGKRCGVILEVKGIDRAELWWEQGGQHEVDLIGFCDKSCLWGL